MAVNRINAYSCDANRIWTRAVRGPRLNQTTGTNQCGDRSGKSQPAEQFISGISRIRAQIQSLLLRQIFRTIDTHNLATCLRISSLLPVHSTTHANFSLQANKDSTPFFFTRIRQPTDLGRKSRHVTCPFAPSG